MVQRDSILTLDFLIWNKPGILERAPAAKKINPLTERGYILDGWLELDLAIWWIIPISIMIFQPSKMTAVLESKTNGQFENFCKGNLNFWVFQNRFWYQLNFRISSLSELASAPSKLIPSRPEWIKFRIFSRIISIWKWKRRNNCWRTDISRWNYRTSYR